MSTLVITDAHVVTGDPAGRRFDRADVVAVDGRITAIGPGAARSLLAAGGPLVRIDGRELVAMPGLVNAHVHSNETFEQGAYDKLPLERWLMHSYPPFDAPAVGPRVQYLRAMMIAAQSIRSGVTAIQDDYLNPGLSEPHLAATIRAFRDAGLRAAVALTFSDKKYLDGIPFGRAQFPAALVAELDALPVTPTEAQFEFAEAMLARHAGAERLKLILGPRGPQRCTPALMERVGALARSNRLPVHMHVLETRVQAVTAQEQFGMTFVRALERFGLLNEYLTMNHAVWLTDDDIARMAAARVSTTHNPLSNMKLGSGTSPVAKLRAAGVNVAIGSDGPTTSDTAYFQESVRAAALAHRFTDGDPDDWLGADEAFAMATTAGARSMGMEAEIGSLEVGKRADLALLDRDHWSLIPLNDAVRQLAFTCPADAVHTVVVNGTILMQDRRILTFDEAAIRTEAREAAEAYRDARRGAVARTAETLDPLLRTLYARALERHRALG